MCASVYKRPSIATLLQALVSLVGRVLVFKPKGHKFELFMAILCKKKKWVMEEMVLIRNEYNSFRPHKINF